MFRSKSADARAVVVVDLSACAYLDITFLGCLLNLIRRHNRQGEQRFLVSANSEKRRFLLDPSNLN